LKCFVDAGNSRIKWRMGPQGDVHACDWLQLDDLPDLLRESSEGKDPQRVVIASVVEPARAEALGDHLEEVWPEAKLQWLRVQARSAGVVVGYADPGQLGVDRYCAMLAAHERYRGQAVVVVNVGTALTLDVLTADGRHEGGMIMPGYPAMLSGLAGSAPVLIAATESVRAAGLLPPSKCGDGGPDQLLARDTCGAITLGCHWMLASALQSSLMAIRAAIADETGDADCRIVVSGGDAERVRSLLADSVREIEGVPDLVLDGAVLLSKRQR